MNLDKRWVSPLYSLSDELGYLPFRQAGGALLSEKLGVTRGGRDSVPRGIIFPALGGNTLTP
jgi:hypothetical protein